MDILESAKLLARQLKEHKSYKALIKAKQNKDNDKQLIDLIGEFYSDRKYANTLTQNGNCDINKLKAINNKVAAVYNKILANKNMAQYLESKAELDKIITKINMILTMSINGADLDNLDVETSLDQLDTKMRY